jgi:subtilisin family serine protease
VSNTNSQGQNGVSENPRYIVKFKDPISTHNEDFLKSNGAGIIHKLEIINSFAIRTPPGLIKVLENNPDIERIEVDGKVFATARKGIPGPPPKTKEGELELQQSQPVPWGVDRIDADLAWATSFGIGVKIAIIDTGCDKDHPDLIDNIKGGVNFVNGPGSKWDDDNGHGTHVAGIVAAQNNEIGVVGVAPNASLYCVKVLNNQGSGWLSDVIAGYNWAVSQGMDVTQASLGTDSDSSSLEDTVDAAEAAGIVNVAAAGNDGDTDPDDDVDYPARYDSVIAVAATDSSDNRAYFASIDYYSSDGPEVELSAPGLNIYSTNVGGGYTTKSGTSMAAPHVSGVVALLLANEPTFTPAQVRERLQTTAEDLGIFGRDNYFGFGLVDAEKAVISIDDEFNEETLDPKWDFQDSNGNGSSSLVDKEGYLTVKSVNSSKSSYPVGVYQHNIGGDFVFTSKVNISGFSGANQDVGIGIGLESDEGAPDTYFKVFVRTKYDWQNWVEIRTSYQVGGGAVYGTTTGYLGTPYISEYWLRITRTGDYVVAEYSTDGLLWISLAGSGFYDNSYITADDVKIFLFADERYGPSVSGYFDFAHVE